MAILFGLMLIPVAGGAGIAVDYSRASNARASLQSAVDAAVIGAVAKDKNARIDAATGIFKSNLDSQFSAATVNFTHVDDNTLQGVATFQNKTMMAHLLGVSSIMEQSVKATATIDPPVAAPPADTPKNAGNVCVLVLDQSGSQALLVNSGAQVDTPACEIHVKSKASPAAIFNSGIDLKTKRICIEGSDVIQNSIVVKNLETRCKTANDPFHGKLPAVNASACTYSGQNYMGNVTLNPGVYCGWFNFNSPSNVKFNPGLYVLKDGGWNVNGGSFTGSDITFYFADMSHIQFNSAMDTDITAPKSGPHKGILFYENVNNGKSNFVFNNSIRNRMEGLIYLPTRNVTFNADSKLASDKTSIVVHRMIWNNVKIKGSPNQDRPIEGPQGGTSPAPTTPVAAAKGPRLIN